MGRMLARLRALNFVLIDQNVVLLTPRGEHHVEEFRQHNLIATASPEA